MVTGVVPSPPRFLPSIFIAHRVQHSHCSSIFHRMLLTHALAHSASQSVHMKKSQRIYTSIHSAGLELTKLTYTRLEVNLIRHRRDRHVLSYTGLVLSVRFARSCMLCFRVQHVWRLALRWLVYNVISHMRSYQVSAILQSRRCITATCIFFFFFFFRTLLLSSFWTSRGHRCRPFSPLVLAFNFFRA